MHLFSCIFWASIRWSIFHNLPADVLTKWLMQPKNKHYLKVLGLEQPEILGVAHISGESMKRVISIDTWSVPYWLRASTELQLTASNSLHLPLGLSNRLYDVLIATPDFLVFDLVVNFSKLSFIKTNNDIYGNSCNVMSIYWVS